MALDHTLWVFSKEKYSDINEFSKAVTKYQIDILKNADAWSPASIEINNSKIAVIYEAWIKSLQNLSDNETLSLDDKDLFDCDSDEMHQLEIIACLAADNGVAFTAVELLFKLHNLMASKELGDHIFFEGLVAETKGTGSLPTYILRCGS